VFVLDSHTVPEGTQKARLSDYAIGLFEALPSRKSTKKAIKTGAIVIDGQRAETGTWVEVGQEIQLIEIRVPEHRLFEFPLEVVFEDDHLAIVQKPAGIVVSGNKFRTVENALPFNLKRSNEPGALLRFLPVHRLDSPTAGLLIIAKTAAARIRLGEQFEQHQIKKTYQAVVMGEAPEAGTINTPIEDKASTTHFKRLAIVHSLRSEKLTLLELFPETGRTHQIRIHLARIGFPILGDQLYGEKGHILIGKGLFLAAVALSFEHPVLVTPLSFACAPPAKFSSFMATEERRWQHYKGNENG